MSTYKQEKSDAVLNVRCKSTTLATLASYFTEHGVFIISKSSLVRLSLEAFEQHLVEEGSVTRCTSLEKARNFLASGGIRNLNPSGRLGQTLLEEGEREATVLDISQDSQGEPKLKDMDPWQQDLVAELTQEREQVNKEAEAEAAKKTRKQAKQSK